MEGAAVDELIAQIDQIGDAASFDDQVDRTRIAEALIAALTRIRTPLEIAIDHCFKEPSETAVIETLLDAGLFEKWVQAGGADSTVDELGRLIDMDTVLLKRLLQLMATNYLLHEVEKDTYRLTTYTKALGETNLASGYKYALDAVGPCLANLPKFFASTKYRNPTDLHQSNWQHWRGPNETCFSYLGDNLQIGKAFNDFMAVFSNSKPPWFQLYPVNTIPRVPKNDRPLIVDVGGGVGHDLERFRDAYPGHFPDGSLVVQDLPEVIKTTRHDGRPLRAVGHDFFKPQPEDCRGAYIYFLHVVLHDWPDADALKIVQNLARVMEKGYSRLLVYESVMATQRPNRRVAFSDLCMMAMFSAGERNESRWSDLFQQAGLRITRTFSSIEIPETLMEVELI